MEFINRKHNNRKKLVQACLFFLSVELVLLCIQYLTEPHSIVRYIAVFGFGHFDRRYISHELSYNELIIFSILFTIGFLGFATYSKIILRVNIDLDEDNFTIEYIDRFGIKPKTHTVKTSYIQTQLDDTDNQLKIESRRYNTLGVDYSRHQNLYLTHKAFGTIMLSTLDFGEEDMPLIVDIFEQIKLETAEKIRRKRKKSN